MDRRRWYLGCDVASSSVETMAGSVRLETISVVDTLVRSFVLISACFLTEDSHESDSRICTGFSIEEGNTCILTHAVDLD